MGYASAHLCNIDNNLVKVAMEPTLGSHFSARARQKAMSENAYGSRVHRSVIRSRRASIAAC